MEANMDYLEQYAPTIIHGINLKDCHHVYIGPSLKSFVQGHPDAPDTVRDLPPEQLLKEPQRRQMNKVKKYMQRVYSTKKAYMKTLGTNIANQKLHVKHYFVEPEIYAGDHRNPERERVLVSQIFEDTGENCPPERILIVGESGYGKTTLCTKIAYDWAVLKPPHYLSRFSLLFFMDLKQLLNDSLEESVYEKFSEAKIDDRNFIDSLIANLASNVLILLDGCEEYTMNEEIFNFISECNSSFLSDATIVFTCRPNTAQDISSHFQQCLYLKGFSRQKKHSYIDKLIREQGQYKRHLLNQVNLDEENYNISKCPLILQDMCVIHDIRKESNKNLFRDARNFLHVSDIYGSAIFLLCQTVWRDDNETYNCEVFKVLSETGKCFWEDSILDNSNERNRIAGLFRILVRIGMLTEVIGEESSLKDYLLGKASHFSYLEYCTALYLLREDDVPVTRELSYPNLDLNEFGRLLQSCHLDKVNQIRLFHREMSHVEVLA